MKRTNKKGISLIVLVITIIVMIILAAAIVITLNNSGIINKANEAVNLTNMKQVQQIAQVIWAEGFTEDLRGTALESYVKTELAKQDITEDKFNITVTDKGVEITAKENGSTVTAEWVTTTVDGVPIPKGFVASPYATENTKAGGMVIYELTETEIANGATALPEAETQQTSWTTRNQYVWVPVKDLSVNKLTRQKFFAEDNEDWSWVIISDKVGTGFWEVTPDVDLDSTYVNPEYQDCIDAGESATDCAEWCPPITVSNYVTQKTKEEVTAMYASVEKYGGFYIARYETGLIPTAAVPTAEQSVLTGRSNVGSMMNLQPYNYIGWSNSEIMTVETGGAVEVARSLYTKTDSNYGVVSTLTYGVQWDAVVQWLKDKGMDILDSTVYGNYSDHEIKSSTELNEGAKYSEDYGESYESIPSDYTKSNSHIYTTGALKAASVNNIYDMAGNLDEWTMEGFSTNRRAYRGGDFNIGRAGHPVASRLYDNPIGSSDNPGFRSALYIKVGEQVEKQYYVTFTVQDHEGKTTTHKAYEGMKWEDWLGSSLDNLVPNDVEYTIGEVGWKSAGTTYLLYSYIEETSTINTVKWDDTIISSGSYKIMYPPN